MKTNCSHIIDAMNGKYRGRDPEDSTSPYKYDFVLLDASTLVDGGSIKIEFTVMDHPESRCVGWSGVETYSVEEKNGVYSLVGTDLRASNDACQDVYLILGPTRPNNLTLTPVGESLRYYHVSDDTEVMLHPQEPPEAVEAHRPVLFMPN